MRADSAGLFWEDLPKVKTKGNRGPKERGAIPPIPVTGWTPPSEMPNLSGAKVIGLDTETWDPELLTAGPGWGRGKGHIIGVSLSVEDGTSWYFPMRHGVENGMQVLPEHEAAMNMDPQHVLNYLQHVLKGNAPKVGANLMYDVGWLLWEGVTVGGKLYDVQFAEALLNSETPSVALESLGERYLDAGKESSIMYDWLARWCGGVANDRQRKHLYLTPPSLAGPYAEGDASMPIKILEHQWPLMEARGVLELFDIECRLIPLLVKMRTKGAPVSVAKAEEVNDALGGDLVRVEKQLLDIAGQPVNPNAGDSIKSAFTKLGIPHPTKKHKKTGLTVVSFDAARLEAVEHPLTSVILEYRRIRKVRDTFIQSYILDKHVNGRIHCSFHPLKGDGNGARSGRFSSSDPNLQNIPVRSAIGKLVREVFEASIRWRSYDYSSIEYRMLAHFAVGEGADAIRAIYAADPTADYHKIVGDLIKKLTGLELARDNVKTINFGIIYGMALNALATALKLEKSKAQHLLNDYHAAAPYAKATMDMCSAEVHQTGHVVTVLGRKSDFNGWTPKKYQEGRPVLNHAAACAKWGPFNIERSHTHKALNRKLQGSAADVMKKAMVDAYEAGLFEDHACGMPILTVHDELDFDDTGDIDNPAWAELKHIMENCMGNRLRVPLLVDAGIGKTWGDAH
jgi:DNA polymerase I-like protein with 3'-5' exonuclease and polymerase domains